MQQDQNDAQDLRGRKQALAVFVILALVALAAVVFSVAGNGDSSDSEESAEAFLDSLTSDTTVASDITISQGIGSRDATDDITEVKCGVQGGSLYTWVTVRNLSSEPSDYSIEVAAESADSSVRYDDTSVYVNALLPNQTTTEKGIFLGDDIPDGATCRVMEVERTAST